MSCNRRAYEDAVLLRRLAAEQGNSSAQNNLGSCYAGGNGVKQDFAEAVRWFKLAAEGGHGPAQYNLGLCYFHGAAAPPPACNVILCPMRMWALCLNPGCG